ncbi:MAG: cytochrome c biogenesis protein CcsA [Flavobacteriaceae bacterium]|nr:cytochrome c biogenesis protein CcsA [Flavobacteriaceae bacterium]
MKRIYNTLFSTRLTAVLFILFATTMAIATFIENDFGTQTAKAVVYSSWWFEWMMILFVVNFIGNIKKYDLLKKEKRSNLIMHLSFILIIFGAAITRYVSFEGIMPIYEGETTNLMLSDKAYVKVHIDDDKEQKKPISNHYLFAKSPESNASFIATVTNFLNFIRGGNNFTIKTDFKGKPVSIKYVNFIPNAYEELEIGVGKDTYLKIVESSGDGRHEHYIKAGETLNIHNALVSYEDPSDGAINIFTENDTLKINSPFPGNYMIMASQTKGDVVRDSTQTFHMRSLYQLGNLQFVIPDQPIMGKMKMVSGKKEEHPRDLLELEVQTENSKQNITIYGNSFNIEPPVAFTQDSLNFRLSYGSKQVELPFSIKLRDFQLERYPGSMSPKSYASEITVVDKDKSFDFRIFMNHVLDYQGYRFFQSSYNDSGEIEQTFLSVNHDKWGTWTSYLGYALLFLGLIWSLFAKQTRFSSLLQNLEKIKKKKEKITVLLLLIGLTSFAQTNHNRSYEVIDSLLTAQKVSKEHAQRFGELVIQDEGGRMKPVNTFASELLRKLSKKDTYDDFDANQVLVSIISNPRAWYFVPFIYIKKENTKVRDYIGIPQNQKFARFSDFFTEKGEYKLTEEVAKAHKKKIKNKYEESILSIDGRANLLFGALEGGIFKFFPLADDVNNKWYAFPEVGHAGFKGSDSLYVSNIIPLYSQAIADASKSKDYTKANEFLDSLHKYQRKFGENVIPSEKKIKLELFYNKYDIFKGLYWKYMLASLFMFIVVIIHIFNNNKLVKTLIKLSAIIIGLLFVYQTIGLGIRWYISGHAPWSNGYESMIYVAWATMLFGLILGRKSSLTLAATTFVTSMLLMVAHWNWMDPSIGNLVPVLDSYWLMVHVAIIVASYGPFTISTILGMIALILYSVTTKSNKKKLKLAINEITTISEMSLTIGLVLLVIGNFLGGIWANESWGRYWGWDPKETWALISIMIYSFVLHMRLIPALKNSYVFNMVTVFAFTSILMTYLGVNHLLSGLHSYAAGESAAIPNQIWGWLALSIFLSVIAYFKFKKFYKK